MPDERLQRWIIGTCLFCGLLLTVIGIRFLLVPESAAGAFGLADPPRYELFYIIGLRDVWLGLFAVALAAFRQYRALMFGFGIGALVCFADAGIAAASSGKLPQVAFHVGSGILCAALALLILRIRT
jgi:uncharacterized membrane protein